MNDKIYIRTIKAGDPRELMIDGQLHGTIDMDGLADIVCELTNQLARGKGMDVTLQIGSREIELSWVDAHQLALSAMSTMRWG